MVVSVNEEENMDFDEEENANGDDQENTNVVDEENMNVDDEENMNADEEEAPKRRVLPSVLESFTLLRDAKDNFAVEGGAKLLTFLARSEDEVNMEYSLKRIIRSLGANQLSMRTGYFSTLTVLLGSRQDITVHRLLELVQQELHHAESKSEVGDVSMGKILVCGAALRSGLALRASDEEQRQLLSLLFTASGKRSYLNPAAYLLLVDFVETLDEQQFKSIVWSNVKAQVKKSVQDQTLDSLYFLIRAQARFPGVMKIRKFLGVEEVVCEDTVHVICEKLMNVTVMNQTNHPIYHEIGVMMANSEHLKLFWTTYIDSHLTKHNRNRELVAIKLLKTILDNIKSNYEVIPELLTKNFFKLFLDWFKGLQTASKYRNQRIEEDDNKMMIKKERELLNSLANALKSAEVPSAVKVDVLKKLLFNPGDMNLAEITSTTIVKNLIISLNKEGVKKAAKLFKAVLLNDSKKFLKEGAERSWYNYERLKASEYLSHLVGHPTVADDINFRLNYMKLLMCFGFFKIGGNENVVVSADLTVAIKTSFYRCLNSRFPTVEGLVDILRSLCSFINDNLSQTKVREKLIKQFPEQNMECWVTLNRICDNIENNTDKKKADNVFLVLLYQLGLFLFSEPKYVEMAKGSIKELASCYDHYKKDGKKKKRPLKEGDLSEAEPEWIEVLIEVLLSILSSESSVLRAAVQCVFRLLWEYLTPSSIGQIVSVLDPDSDSNPLMQEDSDSEDSESDESNADEKDKKENGENENEEDESASDTEVEDEDDEMKIPDQLRLAVQKALGNAAPDTDTESVDADTIGEEEGKQLDKALSEAFKLLGQGKNKKSKKDRKDKKTLADFRIRVLDLIDIYLEKEPAMDICLGMLAPLMRCLEFCIQDNQQRELQNRVRKTLKLLTNVKRFSTTEGVTVELLTDYLTATIEKGSRTQFVFQAVGDMVTECGAFIVHCSQKIEAQISPRKKKKQSPLLEIYKTSLIKFFQNRNCLLPIIFFHKILQIDWEGNYDLVPIIIENTFSANVRQFRRHEGLGLLDGFYTALKRLKPDNVTAKLQSVEVKFEEAVKNSFDDNDFVVKDQFFKLLRRVLTSIEKFYASNEETCPIDLKTLSDLLVTSKHGMKTKRDQKEEEVKKNSVASDKNSVAIEKNSVTSKKNFVTREKNFVTTKKNFVTREKNSQANEKNSVASEQNSREPKSQKRHKIKQKKVHGGPNKEPKQKKMKT